jgi:hypothetical protein
MRDVVENKIRYSIVPYLVSGELLKKSPINRLYEVYQYCEYIFAALVGVGVSTPLLRQLMAVHDPASGSSKASASANLTDLTFVWPTFFALLVWIGLNAYLKINDGQKRALLARSCSGQLQRQAFLTHEAVKIEDAQDALNKLVEIQQAVTQIVDRAIPEGAWPWSGPAPNIDRAVNERTASLVLMFPAGWSAGGTKVDRLQPGDEVEQMLLSPGGGHG